MNYERGRQQAIVAKRIFYSLTNADSTMFRERLLELKKLTVKCRERLGSLLGNKNHIFDP